MSVGRFLQQAAAGAGEAVYVDDVFSTYLYEGNGSTQTITNGIDLDGEGGLVWLKNRASGGSFTNNVLVDSTRTNSSGYHNNLYSNLTDAQYDPGALSNQASVTGFNSSGFSLGGNANTNYNGGTYASWTFRKQPGFFDVVTWTGDGVSGRAISHSLGSSPGMIIIKRTSGSDNWVVWHRSLSNPQTKYLLLNYTVAEQNQSTPVGQFGGQDPTSTEFYVGPQTEVNSNGQTYVAYLFAHDAQDFGTNSDESIIKCGSWTSAGNAGPVEVNLGWEPQFILWKRADASTDWVISDNMRGMTADGSAAQLYPNQSQAEGTSSTGVAPTATGFKGYYGVGPNIVGANLIYIAIRRPHKPASEFAATDLFAMDSPGNTSGGSPKFVSGFPVDMAFFRNPTASNYTAVEARLTGPKYLQTNATTAETSDSYGTFDYQNGHYDYFVSSAYQSWMFRRAPGFFDVVAYAGNSVSGDAKEHNLGVTPEMIIIKNRDSANDWNVWHSALSATQSLRLNLTNAVENNSWWTTSPTNQYFYPNNYQGINQSGYNYIAYLFATVPGISKVGSYSGTGATQTIDCGFSSGARFVLIKRTDSTGSWSVFDSERGIVVGNDPVLYLQLTNAETTTVDWLEPDSSGFKIVTSQNNVNASGGTYIFLAIA